MFHSVLKGLQRKHLSLYYLLFLTFQNKKLKGYENKRVYDLASIEMSDLWTCNALQRLNTRAPSSSAKLFRESQGAAAILDR